MRLLDGDVVLYMGKTKLCIVIFEWTKLRLRLQKAEFV